MGRIEGKGFVQRTRPTALREPSLGFRLPGQELGFERVPVSGGLGPDEELSMTLRSHGTFPALSQRQRRMLKANTESTEALSLAHSATSTAWGEALLQVRWPRHWGGTSLRSPRNRDEGMSRSDSKDINL